MTLSMLDEGILKHLHIMKDEHVSIIPTTRPTINIYNAGQCSPCDKPTDNDGQGGQLTDEDDADGQTQLHENSGDTVGDGIGIYVGDSTRTSIGVC